MAWKNASSGIRTHALIRGLELESNALTNSAIDVTLHFTNPSILQQYSISKNNPYKLGHRCNLAFHKSVIHCNIATYDNGISIT